MNKTATITTIVLPGHQISLYSTPALCTVHLYCILHTNTLHVHLSPEQLYISVLNTNYNTCCVHYKCTDAPEHAHYLFTIFFFKDLLQDTTLGSSVSNFIKI